MGGSLLRVDLRSKGNHTRTDMCCFSIVLFSTRCPAGDPSMSGWLVSERLMSNGFLVSVKTTSAI